MFVMRTGRKKGRHVNDGWQTDSILCCNGLMASFEEASSCRSSFHLASNSWTRRCFNSLGISICRKRCIRRAFSYLHGEQKPITTMGVWSCATKNGWQLRVGVAKNKSRGTVIRVRLKRQHGWVGVRSCAAAGFCPPADDGHRVQTCRKYCQWWTANVKKYVPVSKILRVSAHTRLCSSIQCSNSLPVNFVWGQIGICFEIK